MFVKAIEDVSKFTRPIHTITKPYKGKTIIPGAGTLFFVNEEGYAITCKHVINIFKSTQAINSKYKKFARERDELKGKPEYLKELELLEKKYSYSSETSAFQNYNLIGCVDKMSGFTVHEHPDFDLAIIKFNDFNQIKYTGHATFPKDGSKVKQGKFLCRLGFPFPEFNNFLFDDEKEELRWTDKGKKSSPIFPLEGMVTRFVSKKGKKMGIELSTPGLRGQSGGPLFDENGVIFGIQSLTKHLHLGFDIENLNIRSGGKLKKVNDYSFIHLGECVHVEIIKDFLTGNKVKIYEV